MIHLTIPVWFRFRGSLAGARRSWSEFLDAWMDARIKSAHDGG